MSKREYMRGHYEECMGGGRVLPNVPKDLVIVGSEKGGMKRPLEGGKFYLIIIFYMFCARVQK